MYVIKYADGSPSTTHETYEAALDTAQLLLPLCVIGHDGDLTDGGDRTLIWPSEADAEGDDGARAVAQIVEAAS